MKRTEKRYIRKLNDKEEEILMEEIKKLDNAEKIMEIPISYEEKGIKKGIEKGIRKVAMEMLKDGISVERVARITGLEIQELENMVQEL
jgi:predicted transposase/invertase (TIGR01784 family)